MGDLTGAGKSLAIILGVVCFDRFARLDRWPGEGEGICASSSRLLLGGEAANTASHLARWGGQVLLAGSPRGEGHEALLLDRLLGSVGLSSQCLFEGGRIGECDVYATPGGERTIIARQEREGGLPPLPALPWDEASWWAIDHNDLRLCEAALARRESSHAGLYMLDFPPPKGPVRGPCVWQHSARWLGCSGDERRCLETAADVSRNMEGLAIVTDGSRGFCFAAPGRPPSARRIPRLEDAVDSTGAGDAFRAGMLHGLMAGWSLDDCLDLASGAGALACLTEGGASSTFTVEEALTAARTS